MFDRRSRRPRFTSSWRSGPGERHGYAIMAEVEQLTNGALRLAPGTLYTTIKRLLGAGLIEETGRATRPAPR